jgi:cell wall-associated NlpC family hydrolase
MGSRGPEHVGIYLGNDQFIQSPHTGDVVKVSKLSTYGGYVGARRYHFTPKSKPKPQSKPGPKPRQGIR